MGHRVWCPGNAQEGRLWLIIAQGMIKVRDMRTRPLTGRVGVKCSIYSPVKIRLSHKAAIVMSIWLMGQNRTM